jgi:hypothetical protein
MPNSGGLQRTQNARAPDFSDALAVSDFPRF